MKVLVGCEYSGAVRDAFLALGHDAISCDLHPTEVPGPHYQGDLRDLLYQPGWDLLIAFPDCTHLCVSGARWWPEKRADGRQASALAFVQELMDAPIPRIAIENPVGLISTAIRPASQYVHPWWFGAGETKKTGLWLRGLELLKPTNIVPGREARIHRMAPGPNRWRERSRTLPGFAAAMAAQWGGDVRAVAA